MPSPARVRSIEAIESFRSALIVYISQARPALEEISTDVMRTRGWIEEDQRVHWEREIRKRGKVLEEAQAALFSSRIGLLAREGTPQQLAVHRAKRAMDEAEDKLRVVKRWRRDFDGRVQPLVKQVEKLHTVLTQDLVQAVALLGRIQDTLAAYADRAPVASSSGGSLVEGGSPGTTNAPSVSTGETNNPGAA